MTPSAILVYSRFYSVIFQHTPVFELHIRRKARIQYSVSEALFSSTGNVIFPNYRSVHELTFAINKSRGVLGNPEQQIRAGYINAAGLLDEISHFLVRIYSEQENPGVLSRAYSFLENTLGKVSFEKILKTFLNEFPPVSVYKNLQSVDEYFSGSTENRLHKEVTLEELTMLYLSNLNPAMKKIKELIDDSPLAATTSYYAAFVALDNFFAGEKPFGPDQQPLLQALRAPMISHPDNIEAQLGFLKEKWGLILSPQFLEKITGGFDFSKEEERFIWNSFNPFGGKPHVETFVPEYKKIGEETGNRGTDASGKKTVRPEDLIYDEPQHFTPDTEWMPNVVIIAKNTYVWLDQLSKKYQRAIRRLDEIPDEELDQLARWNFTGLWLIGVWERSTASKKIKQITGNLDAVSSAYSLYDYTIAHDIGGEEAFQNFHRRAWQRGIRLAGDMVPNHMGLYSKWIVEHPEYFIQSEQPPYPNYRFTGHNLSDHPDVELRIEDGYWSRNDAAVVFQRVDKRNGEVRYMYHGNDGTSMPWNDTAQLNLLRADVREAIIQSILHVARKFSIIRFDAAMTLAKKHYQRLWFPMPGTSGVPSRQDYGLSRAEFDSLFPKEFWREVVDRFNAEMPQTLLLAEAFWLMEGYFVRTLGMHRVYNSAFMHMLMKEENQKFRALIKNTLEFNPEILKRYVNFMSNPDEQTAIEQFGKEDKYFGVAMMMVTLPGLPMFAHGQVEGYKEKYGMEYQRAYYNETPDHWLVRRHEEEIFPLMQKRHLFSHVHNFEFYDFMDDRGFVNENVFAYSNRAGDEKALFFFHNSFAECEGRIQFSLQKSEKEGGSVRSISLFHALGLEGGDAVFYKVRERRRKLEYLLPAKEIAERGWKIRLHAFHYVMFTDFVRMTDGTGELQRLADQLNGEGVESIDRVLMQLRLSPIHDAVLSAFKIVRSDTPDVFKEKYLSALEVISNHARVAWNREKFESEISLVQRATDLSIHSLSAPSTKRPKQREHTSVTSVILLHRFLLHSYEIIAAARSHVTLREIISELQLDNVIKSLCLIWNADTGMAVSSSLFGIFLRHHSSIITKDPTDTAIVDILLSDFETADFLGVNQHEDVWYYNKEKFEELFFWIKTIQFLESHRSVASANHLKREYQTVLQSIDSMTGLSSISEFQIDKLKEMVLDAQPPVVAGIKKRMSIVKRRISPGTEKQPQSSNVKRITKKKRDH